MSQIPYLFNDPQILIDHVVTKIDNPTQVRLHKTLYFLWAYYSGSYGLIYDTQHQQFPEFLCPLKFEALRYGPVVVNDQNEIAELALDDSNPNTPHIYQSHFQIQNRFDRNEVAQFLDSIIDQCNQAYDYQLIIRSQQDETWHLTYNEITASNPHHIMNPNIIKNEYETIVKNDQNSHV